MTAEQKNEYMSSVRWTTALYFAIGAIPLIIAFVWFLSDIKADVTATKVEVKDARTEAREQITALGVTINRRIDSIEYNHKTDIQSIWIMLNNRNQKTAPMPLGLFIEKVTYVNGKRIVSFVPIK